MSKARVRNDPKTDFQPHSASRGAIELCQASPPLNPKLTAEQFQRSGASIPFGGVLEDPIVELSVEAVPTYISYGFEQYHYLEIEVRPISEQFTGVMTHSVGPVVLTGPSPTILLQSQSISLAFPDTKYKWAARQRVVYVRCWKQFDGSPPYVTKRDTIYGPWVAFGETTKGAFRTPPLRSWKSIKPTAVKIVAGRKVSGAPSDLDSDNSKYYSVESRSNSGREMVIITAEAPVPADTRHLRIRYKGKSATGTKIADLNVLIDQGSGGWMSVLSKAGLDSTDWQGIWQSDPMSMPDVAKLFPGNILRVVIATDVAAATPRHQLASDELTIYALAP